MPKTLTLKRSEAKERNEYYDSLATAEKIEMVKTRLKKVGGDSTKELEKLSRKLESEKKPKKVKKEKKKK